MDKKQMFIGIALFWLVLIVGFIAVKEYTLQSGEEVILKLVPIDPQDLFRGDYVVLRYEISRLDMILLDSDIITPEAGDEVYVTLDVVDGYGVATGLYQEKPSDQLFIKGKVRYAFRGSSSQTYIVRLTYGIEDYFVPEGQGKWIERLRMGELTVKVSIDRFGNALVKSLLVNGEEITYY